MSEPVPTRISQLIDWIYGQLQTTFPEHLEILDTDELDENPATVLAKGFGVAVEAAENSERCLENTAYYYRRELTVILTRETLSLGSDSASRKKKLKLALEDLNLLLLALVGQRTVVSAGKVLAFDFKFVSDSGARFTVIKDIPHIFIELTVSAEYREPKT